jgi:hypothetical protein
LLDYWDLDVSTRNEFINALLRLCQASGLYPRSLLLAGVHRPERYPTAIGSFGSVWQGTVRGEQVAVKVPRITRVESDRRKLFKVCVFIMHDLHSRT